MKMDITPPSYEELQRRYIQLAAAMGADINKATHEDCVHVAQILNKVKVAITHERAEDTGAYFITGESGSKDESGLPENIMICPTYGLAGFAMYTKITNYSEPGY
jgi:hypothetical protein